MEDEFIAAFSISMGFYDDKNIVFHQIFLSI